MLFVTAAGVSKEESRSVQIEKYVGEERTRKRYITFYIARVSHSGRMALFILSGRNI